MECFPPLVLHRRGSGCLGKKQVPRVLIRRSLSSGDGAWALTWAFARGAARWSVRGKNLKKKKRVRRAGVAPAALGRGCTAMDLFIQAAILCAH